MGNLPSGLPEEIADKEDLVRFLTSRSQFNTLTVKPAVFLPSHSDLETSVFRHGREPAKSLWKIGAEVAGAAERSLYGAAVFKAAAVRNAKLEVFADEPPPRHAAIRKWPTDTDPELQKAQHKERAVALASAAGEPFLVK